MEATFVLGSDVYESRWIYDHKYNPTIVTTLNGESVETPPIIQWDHLGWGLPEESKNYKANIW